MEKAPSMYVLMRDRLINGLFSPGQRLRAEVLGPEFGCSASTMREMLFRLSTVGLVEFQEQRGFRVPALSAELQHELTHMRIMLECEGACLSVRLGGLEWESKLTAAHHKLKHIETHISQTDSTPEDMALWAAAENEFHRALIDACGSTLLVETHAVFYNQFRQQLVEIDKEFEFLPENMQQHSAIVTAALDHDEKALCEAISEHLSRNLQRDVPFPRAQSRAAS